MTTIAQIKHGKFYKIRKKSTKFKVIIRKQIWVDTAHKLAYEYAKKNDYTNFISMDADLSHDPSEIPKIMSHLDEFPFVIGSRYSLVGKCEMS